MIPHTLQAEILISQKRFDDAATALRQAIAADPEDGRPYAMLAIVLIEQEKQKDALAAAKQGLQLSPNAAYIHYALAVVHLDMGDAWLARRSIKEAISLQPENAYYFGFLARTYIADRNWEEALAATESGLAIEPEDTTCANLRSLILVQMGRRQEAVAALGTTLAEDPNNPLTHANKGWALLHQSKPNEAMGHFQEALRLNPNLKWARDGIIEAMKARNPVYRIMLAYFLWMSRLSQGTQWAVIIGMVIFFRFARSVSESNPALTPYINILLALYLGFVMLSWTANDLFNLLLRTSRFGRLALPPDRIIASNWMGLSLLAAGATAIAGLLLGNVVTRGAWMEAAVMFVALIIPISAAFQVFPFQPKSFRLLAGYAALLAALIPLHLLSELGGATGPYIGIFVLGIVANTWVSNIVISRNG